MNKHEAIRDARKLAEKTGETVIIYVDYDMGAGYYETCTETHWEFMVDEGMVNQNWIYDYITP